MFVLAPCRRDGAGDGPVAPGLSAPGRLGRLEKEEWGRLRGNPGNADRNEDGVLTEDELARHLAGYADRRDGQSKKPDKKSRRKKSSSRVASSGTKSYRFVAPRNRLPKGLPDWYAERDLDGDGLAVADC